jgi:hypothetical protein
MLCQVCKKYSRSIQSSISYVTSQPRQLLKLIACLNNSNGWHWLPVEQHIRFNNAVTVYKCRRKLTADYPRHQQLINQRSKSS